MDDLPRHAADDGVDRARRRRRMRSVAVGVGVTVVVAAVLVDRETEPDYAAVCVDPDTQERVDDDQCREHHSGVGSAFAWYYLGRASRVPAVGAAVTGGTYNGSGLSGRVQRGGLPAQGGSTVHSSTVRGGFGGSSHGFGS